MFTASITVDEVIDALANFLQPLCGNAQIVRAQVNRVPMPLNPCVVLTELLQVDLSTPEAGNWTPTSGDLTVPTRLDVQIDFYDGGASEFCKAVKGVFRSVYAVSMFPAGITPLYCSDGVQASLVTGEQQYESRWTITASLQYNASVTVPMQSAEELAANPLISEVTI